MTLFDGFPPILRGFDVIKVVCVRYNLYRSYNCEITTVVSVTISHDFTVLPSSMNRITSQASVRFGPKNNRARPAKAKRSRTSGQGQTIAHVRPRPNDRARPAKAKQSRTSGQGQTIAHVRPRPNNRARPAKAKQSRTSGQGQTIAHVRPRPNNRARPAKAKTQRDCFLLICERAARSARRYWNRSRSGRWRRLPCSHR